MENSSSATKVLPRTPNNKSYIGVKFGRLLVLQDIEYRTLKSGERKRVALCKCECGVEKKVDLANLKRGGTSSCGCYEREVLLKRNTTHGMRHTRFYKIYKDMNKRCVNRTSTNYHSYGGRGIKNEFGCFENFRDTMTIGYRDDLTLERIDVNGNYSPGNCTWIPLSQQSRNKRDTIRYNGGTLIDYCETNGLNCSRIRRRISRGWDIEMAISTPKLTHRYERSHILP